MEFESIKMTVPEKLLQEAINLKRLCEIQQKRLNAQYDLIDLQRNRIGELREENEALNKALGENYKEDKQIRKEIRKSEVVASVTKQNQVLQSRFKVLEAKNRQQVEEYFNLKKQYLKLVK